MRKMYVHLPRQRLCSRSIRICVRREKRCWARPAALAEPAVGQIGGDSLDSCCLESLTRTGIGKSGNTNDARCST